MPPSSSQPKGNLLTFLLCPEGFLNPASSSEDEFWDEKKTWKKKKRDQMPTSPSSFPFPPQWKEAPPLKSNVTSSASPPFPCPPFLFQILFHGSCLFECSITRLDDQCIPHGVAFSLSYGWCILSWFLWKGERKLQEIHLDSLSSCAAVFTSPKGNPLPLRIDLTRTVFEGSKGSCNADGGCTLLSSRWRRTFSLKMGGTAKFYSMLSPQC